MVRKSGSVLLFFSKAILFFAILALFFLGQIYLYELTMYYFWGYNIVLALYTAILYLVSRIYNGFNFGNASLQEIVLSWILCLILVNGFQYFVLSLLALDMLPVSGFIFILIAQIAFVSPMAALINLLYYKLNPAQKVVIIYGNKDKLQEYLIIIAKQWRKFKVNNVIAQHESTGALLDVVDVSESVFFLDVHEKKMDWLLEYCYLHNKHTYALPTFSHILINTASTIWLSNTPVFSLRRPDPDLGTQFIKRLMDILISLVGIVLLSLLMLVVWAVVRFYDNHPAVYKQVRVTRGGRLFTLYKFRSMRPDAEDDGVPRLTSIEDDRITPFGRFIRRTRIDELPQLFNVLSGAMSIVGPRPERPEIAKQYEEIYPNFAFRTKVKAGITGFAQIYGRYNTAPEEKLFLDIMYIETFSILEDIKLMLQTIRVIFQGSGTEGVENGSTTALK
ncbi:MAG: exopolysaccharide biosynthesis polyprenyl glycosylphosphotransferase [Oscillospiraceae bacterium]|jgi:exopolysaccharide biosynthesis polyprenyl glycosylphosphotransferase|nr:exopolysaccharide biosynthesis polyprenyl glycosylphosphotransferase [Oscillospiraceae bacterium]